MPAPIFPGETANLRVILSNSSVDAAISGVTFNNPLPGALPNGLRVSGAFTYTCTDPLTGTTSAGSGTLTAAVGTQSISLANGVIPARANNTDGVCEIILPVTAGTSTGNGTNYIYQLLTGAVQGVDNTGPVSNQGDVQQNVEVRPLNRPTIAKSFNPNPLVQGATGELTITLENSPQNGVGAPIPGFSLVDPLPGNLVVGAPVVVSSSCNHGGAAPMVSSTATSITVNGDLPAPSGGVNGICTVVVRVVGTLPAATYEQTNNNVINASTNFSNSLGIPAAANATAPITVHSPLRTLKTVNSGSLASGETGSFTIRLFNDSASPLSITGFTDDPIDGTTAGNVNAYGLKVIPASLANTCGSTVTATANNTGVQVTGGSIPAGSSCTVTIPFTAAVEQPNTPRVYSNLLGQGAVITGGGFTSQPASASVTVYENLDVQKSVSPANPAPGNPVRYQVAVRNWSAAQISNLVITDPFTSGQTFLTGTIGGNNFTPSVSPAGCVSVSTPAVLGASSVALTINTVPARLSINSPGVCTVTFWAMTPTSAGANQPVNNILPAGSVCYNAGATCNGGPSNSANTNVSVNVLTLAKSFSPGPNLAEGTISRLTIRADNISAQPLINTTISDNLPAAASGTGQMRLANPPNAATTCGGTPTINATPGATSISMNDAIVPARAANGTGAAGSCVLQVDVVGGAGVYTNTATGAGTQTFANGTPPLGTDPVSSNAAVLTYNSVLSAAKSFTPTAVTSGGKSTVRVQLNNSAATALTEVTVTDPLPAGMVLANPTGAYTTCAGATAITGAPGASTISMTGAQIAGSSNCALVFDVIATGSANWVNTIPLGGITAAGGIANQSPVPATLLFNSPTNLSVSKSTNPSTLTFPGQTSRLTIVVTAGSQPVTGLALTDHFTNNGLAGGTPNGMSIAATPSALTTCPAGSVTAIPGATSVSVTLATLAAGSSCNIEVNVTSSAVGGITNRIPVGAVTTDQALSNQFEASTSLTTQSNMGVTKQFTPNVVMPGTRSRLRITFFNPSAQSLSAVSVTDDLPAGVTVPAGPNPLTTCLGATVTAPTAGQVQVSGGTIPAASGGTSASCYAEIDVIVAAQGDYTNTIPANGVTANAGGVPVTNSQPATDVLRAKQPLVVNKAIAGNTLDAGNPGGFTTGTAARAPGVTATLTVRIANPNNAALTSASFTDNLPAGLTIAPVPAAATTCAGGVVTAAAVGTTFRLTGATIPANGACTVSVNVLSNTPGTYTNTIGAGGVTTFEGVSNAEPTRAALLVSTPPGVSKQFAPPVIPPNGTSTLTIFLANSNSSAISLTQALVDNLPTAPSQVRVSATPNVAGTCTLASVTAAANATSVSYANGATIPAGGCTISVEVTAVSPGVHNNNIPAGGLQTNAGINADPANAALTVSTQGYVSGRVFRDNNVTPDGMFQPAIDLPIAGASIELRSGANCSGALVNTTVTDALGNYQFTALPAGTYSVCQPVQPSGTINGTTTAGGVVSSLGSTGTAGTAANPTAASSQITSIVLNGDGTGGAVSGSTNNDFAEIVTSSISGTAFIDQNNNGVQNGPDAPLAGVTIELRDAGNAVIATTVTDASGNYTFTGLPPGTYSVQQPTQPPGTSNGQTIPGAVPNGGTPGTATTPLVAPSRISNIVLPPNTASTGNNFAELPNGRTISGTVFLDYDNNGLLGGTPDHGIAGQTINLSGTDENGNAVTRTTTTDADGNYSFTGLPPGTYTVSQPNQPAGTTNGITSAGPALGTASNPTATSSQIINIVLTGATQVAPANNFAEQPQASPDLAISKTHTPASFAAASSTGYYTITVRNIGVAATAGTITVVDTLPAGMTLSGPATGPGWACAGVAGAATATCTTNAVLAAGATAPLITVPVTVGAGLEGQVLINRAAVSGGSEPPGFEGNNEAEDPTSIATSASLSGHIWRDLDHDRVRDAGEPAVPGWTVELLNGGVVVGTTTTDSLGAYAFTNVAPGSGYEVRFREAGTGRIYGRPVPNESGQAYTNGVQGAGNPGGASNINGVLQGITILPGANIVEQSLPLDPAGVVYDAVTRTPVPGATVTISGPGGFTAADVLGGSVAQVTGVDGAYQFLLLPTAPAGTYTLTVTVPPGYAPGVSALLPPCTNTLTVTAGPPDPALVQNDNTPPVPAAPVHVPATCPATSAGLPGGAGTTQYYLTLNLNPVFPGGSANLVNNHIPIDPMGNTGFSLTKTGDRRVVELGDSVLYTLVVRRSAGAPIPQITVHDRLPAGFTYIPGTARVNGAAIADPSGGVGPQLGFNVGGLPLGGSATLTYRARVGVGSMQGTGLNVATAYGCAVPAGCLTAAMQPVAGSIASNTATYQVKVTGGVFTDEACVLGKIFVDCNGNHIQDPEELGIPGVRLYFQTGQWLVSDSEGKYSQCGLTPRTHVLKVDPKTLPRGARLTTSSNRNLGDAGSLFVDLKNGELHRADFIEGSCSNPVLEQVKARRAQGEVRSVETERKRGPALRFESKPPGAPPQATDSANQPVVQPRVTTGGRNAR